MAEIPRHNGEHARREDSKSLSISEIHKRSLRSAKVLLLSLTSIEDSTTLTESDENIIETAMKNLADVDFMKGNAKGVQLWGQYIELLEDPPKNDIANVYFDAVRLGDETAYSRLNKLLSEEQEENMAKKTLVKSKGRAYSYNLNSPMLNIVIEACANANLPANGWVEKHAIDDNHTDVLKLLYYFQSKRTIGGAKEMGARYRDEVTDQYLNGENKDQEFAFENTGLILSAQDDPDKKKQIFHKFQELSIDKNVNSDTFIDFLSFSSTALKNTENLEPRDLQWIQLTMERYREILIGKGLDPFTAYQNTGGLEISLVRYSGARPAEIVDKINDIIGSQLRMDIAEKSSGNFEDTRNKNFVANLRDMYLISNAFYFVKNGKFNSAQFFISQIANEESKVNTIKSCLTFAKTTFDIEAVKPDEMSLGFDENLVEVFKAKQTLLGGDIEAKHKLAKSYSEDAHFDDNNVIEELVNDCIKDAYQVSRENGHQLASDLHSIFKERNVKPDRIKELANTMLDNDDEAGIQVLYENANRYKLPIQKLSIYALIAKLTAQEIRS